jgi:hypothetical protein
LGGICPTPLDKIADIMGYLIEIDSLSTLVTYARPEVDAPAKVLNEDPPPHEQGELNLGLEQKPRDESPKHE